jgi:hypothetical protein
MNTTQQLKARAEKLRAQAGAAEARAREAERSEALRRKIVAGAWLCARYGPDLSRLGPEARADLSSYLTRDNDRELFALTPHPTPTTEKQP